MILTVTLNTAVDVTYSVRRLVPHTTHRVREAAERPGGKGVNVARVLAASGRRAVVTGFVGGGPTGARLRELLAAEPVVDELLPVAGDTRRTVAVVDTAGGDTTQFNEVGPAVTAPEWSAFRSHYERLLADAEAVALCGSLPPGVPVGGYATLVRAARAAGVPVLLDTSGEPLARGLAARPELVKPNLAELAALTGSREPLRAAGEARRRGAGTVVASLGAEGLLAVTPDGVWWARPPKRIAGNPTGAGDTVAAVLLDSLTAGTAGAAGTAEKSAVDWPSVLARAVALSAATVAARTAGEFDARVAEELLPRVAVERQPRGAA
ncbi:1-phosphofructokinase family hexose kinase [Streptomyces alkaliterrae]|uniref:Hexose kinase n=1 Tax=Streptomyces alkaliterrae TaxID=2213162 RepID=A0A5P0YKE5_9ACTN|nr:1-phosphofructokinase family hexose kinase [Streptomyces alkaliterrae]MBB1258907.1 1-phosphofructokinase family hexose kinase [Streptomyces alkaliterrae]MQS00844.1 hexose kinase [Streptomyces alkaliterrae]